MDTSLEWHGFRLELALLILICGMAASPLHAVTFEGCSWAGPDLDWALDRPLPPVDLVGSLGSREVIDLLHESGAAISFISGAARDPEVHFQRSEATTVGELIDEMMAQTPNYRLDVVSGKFVIYPSDGSYDALIKIGETREERRVMALFPVLRELRSKSPVLRGLGLPALRRFGSAYDDLISVGGTRTVVEHLVSLVAGNPSANFWIHAGADGSITFSLRWADVIGDFLLEAPKKVEVGKEFQIVPRVILVDGTPVTLIGSRCGVHFESADESILKIDQGGRGVAITKGTFGIQARYATITRFVEIEVGDV